jgi:hypothetical protein
MLHNDTKEILYTQTTCHKGNTTHYSTLLTFLGMQLVLYALVLVCVVADVRACRAVNTNANAHTVHLC